MAIDVGYYIAFLFTGMGMMIFMLGGLGLILLAGAPSLVLWGWGAAVVAIYIGAGHIWKCHRKEEPIMGFLNIFGDKEESETNNEREEVDEHWPDECYCCSASIDTPEKGQFVVHRGDASKGVGLCQECTRTYSTLMDNHTLLIKQMDRRDNPIEL